MSHRKVVVFKCIIVAPGIEENCTAEAVEVSIPGTNEKALTRFHIRKGGEHLPDGDYTIIYPHGSTQVRKSGSFWLAPA